MSLTSKLSVVLFVSSILLASSDCGNSAQNKIYVPGVDRWHVHIVNGMGGGKYLFVHCQSKDDDLGTHNLEPGTEFNWTFKTSYFGHTLFWCYLHNDIDHADFDAFWEEKRHEWLHDRCNPNNCIWIAKDDGIYLKNNPQNHDELIHKWEQARLETQSLT